MNYITRSEFRETVLAIYKSLQEFRDETRSQYQRKKQPNGAPEPVSVIAKLDSESSIEARTPVSEQASQRSYYCWSLVVQVFTFLAATGAAGAAIYYGWVTTRMWGEMQTQTCIQREASENAERAWVGLADPPRVTVTSLSAKTFQSQTKLDIENFGKGPALNVFSGSFFALHGHVLNAIESSCNLLFPFVGLKPSWPVSSSTDISKEQWGMVLYPNQPPFVNEHDSNGKSSDYIGQEVFVVGCIVYKDQFGHPHWTKFSYSTGPYVTQIVRDASAFQHLYVSSANNYTDDAEKKPSCLVTQPTVQ